MVDQANRLPVGIHGHQGNPVFRMVQLNNIMLEMAGLAVHPQVRGTGGALSMHRVAIEALPTRLGLVRRSRDIGMAMDARHELMGVVFK